jgi:ribonuclease HII
LDIDDSKKLTPKKRKYLYEKIFNHAVSIGIGIIDPAEIDRVNILQASLISMKMAAENLFPKPDYLLIDGKFNIALDTDQESVIKGDALSISIAAASVIAKETRDRIMERYDMDYPLYGFAQHKGYPTRAHREAIKKYGCCPIHRRSFKGVKEFA